MTDTLMSRMSVALNVPQWVVATAGRRAPNRYKVYKIPKRSGDGMRTIAQPARESKALQRWLIDNELRLLPLHKCTTAYRTGSSIRENASRHVAHRYLLKADFANFFPSIKANDVALHLRKYIPERYTEGEIAFICHSVLWRPNLRSRELELCIGAPSSPCISNTIMYDFDVEVERYCVEYDITYSRYADDLAFSTNTRDQLTLVPEMLRRLLRRLEYPRISLNESKHVFTSKKYRRTVTGLVLASQGYVSLGRDRKRLIRSMVDHFRANKMNEEQRAKLRGLLAFAQDVEPDFIHRLTRHYGEAIIGSVMSSSDD